MFLAYCMLGSRARQSCEPEGAAPCQFTLRLLLLNIHTPPLPSFVLTRHRNSIQYPEGGFTHIHGAVSRTAGSRCSGDAFLHLHLATPCLTTLARVSGVMAPAASVHVPAQHLGPDDPAKDDPLWPAWTWDSDWPKPGYMIISSQDGATRGSGQALFAGSREAGVPLSLLCLPTTAPVPKSCLGCQCAARLP